MSGSSHRWHMIEDEKLIYQGRVIRLNIERVRLPNQSLAELEIIHHPGGAAVLAMDDQQRVCLLYQFRHAAGGWVWELPAGKIDHHEPHFQTAQRELQEEAGCHADNWHYLGRYLSSPGVFTEVVHLYLARELTMVGHQPEEHEVFSVEWRPFTEALAMAQRGEIMDGKTLVALFLAQQHFQHKP
ncbi:MAG: NUDIX hydrolase [Steroidobacteraceae bacterium]